MQESPSSEPSTQSSSSQMAVAVVEGSAGVGSVPASRSRALTRGLLWLSAALLALFMTLVVYSQLTFLSSTAPNRLVHFSIAVVALPLPVSGLLFAVVALRWLLLGLWPGRVGVWATPRELALRFGPFGNRAFDVADLTVRYPFELIDDDADAGFEAYLPQERQFQEFLPRMTHDNIVEPINQTILRFAHGDEAQIAAALRPMIATWRGEEQPDGAQDGTTPAK